jgi:hypothetical protein
MDQNRLSIQELHDDAALMESLMCELYNHSEVDHNRLIRNLGLACKEWVKVSPGSSKEAIELITHIGGLYIQLSKNYDFIGEKWMYYKNLSLHYDLLEGQIIDQSIVSNQ